MNYTDRRYVSDYITRDDVLKWNIDDKVLVTAGTGTGKTFFCKNTLCDIAEANNKKVLIVSNRTLLKEQIWKDTIKKRDIIDVISYQSMEERYIGLAGIIPKDIYSEYLYIFFDEFHYVYSDSDFRTETEYSMFMIENIHNSIMIFATATPQILYMDDRLDFAYKYELDYSYSNIKTITIVRETVDMIELFNKNDYGKSMFFFNSTENAYNTKITNNDYSFIVSKQNPKARYNTITDYESIKYDNKFISKKLCTTKTLDNGVNIEDEAFNKIFIDIFDPIEIEQCVGRKRFISRSDFLHVFIKAPSFPYIRKKLTDIEHRICDYEERINLTEEEYRESKYYFKTSKALTPNMKPRRCYYLSLLYKKKIYNQFLTFSSNEDYISGYYREKATEHCLQDWLKKNEQADILFYSNVLRQKRMYDLLIKYKDVAMLQKYVKNNLLSEIREAYIPRNQLDFRTISIDKLNVLLENLHLPIKFNCIRKRVKNIIEDYYNGILIDIDEEVFDMDINNKKTVYFFTYNNECFMTEYEKLFFI